MGECLFCKIARSEIKANVVYENDDVLAFHDINPQAPVHVLVIPKLHIPTLNEIGAEHAELLGKLWLAIAEIARAQGFDRSGYRTVINCNADAGQTVFHLHAHVLAGKAMGWPPY